jgi:general stress protein 26
MADVFVDARKAAELWQIGQTIFFPQGPTDPALVVLRVVGRSVRIWNGNESLPGIVRKFVDALLRGEAADLGDVRDVTLRS